MPRKASGTNSASKQNQSVAAIKEQFQQEVERQKINYDEAVQGLIKLKDPKRNASTILSAYDRETIRTYLQSPAQSSENLRKAVLYLYIRSQILYRISHWYSSMWDLRCRQVVPDYSLIKNNDKTKMLKQYENTLTILDSYHIHENWGDIALRCYLEDVCYIVWYRDGKNAFPYILDPSECKIDGRYYTGDFSYAIDASKWRSAQRRELAEWLGSPFKEILQEYDSTGERWIHMDDKYGAAFKYNSDRIDLIIPPFAPLLQAIAGLNDTADLQAIRDKQSVYKLLLLPMRVLTGAKNSDDFEISPSLLLKYYDKLLDILPDYVAAAPVPGEVTNDSVIDFSTTSTDKDLDRLSQSQDTVLATSGGGAVLNSSAITSTAAFNAWLKAESEFAISTLMPQVQGFVNRMLGYDVSGTPCDVKFFEVTVYTKDEVQKKLLESCQYSFSNRIFYNTFNGISERSTLAMEFLEVNGLGLPTIMNHPLQSSYTSSGEVGEGRPEQDPETLSPSGERSRNE